MCSFLHHYPCFARKHFKQVFCSIYFFTFLQGFDQMPTFHTIYYLLEQHIYWHHNYVINSKDYTTNKLFSIIYNKHSFCYKYWNFCANWVNLTRSHIEKQKGCFFSLPRKSFDILALYKSDYYYYYFRCNQNMSSLNNSLTSHSTHEQEFWDSHRLLLKKLNLTQENQTCISKPEDTIRQNQYKKVKTQVWLPCTTSGLKMEWAHSYSHGTWRWQQNKQK